MKTKDLSAVTSALIEKMKTDGYSQARIEDTTWILGHFEHYCSKHGIDLVTVPVAVEFVRDSFGFDYYNTTSRFQTVLRRPLLILFVFPLIRKDPRNKLLSCYSKEEIRQLLSCIDTGTASGKCMYAAICLMAYLGMRVGDIITLRFCDIDWSKGMISYAQQKTGNPLSLPLLDEVKFPLIDYIKNGRHESADPEYVFVTMYAPYTRYTCTSSMFRMVERCMQTAGISYEGRHHGPHSLRHSLATNMLSENMPISATSNIMGHSSTRTTEIYLTVDETHLKEISLEVPNV